MTAVLLALAFAGCGKDSNSKSTAQTAATATTPAATTTTGTSKGAKKKSGSGSKIPTATTDAAPSSSGTKSSGSKSSSTTAKPAKKTSTKPKAKATKSPIPAVTPKSSGSDLTSGTGSGPIGDRQDVVAVLRRYYKGFIVHDGGTVCSLLTSAGQQVMVNDGNGKNCQDSVKKLIARASAGNVALLQRTRDGLHADDIRVTGDTATAQIGKASSLRLIQQGGHWLLRSPNVINQ
jgi:hypothetical protein